MRAFIEEYIDWVKEAMGDPSLSNRLTPEKLLRDLRTHHLTVYEKLLKVSGPQSTIGYCESSITLENGKEYYRLPGNFRRFISFDQRLNGDPNYITASLNTIAPWERGPGIIINSPEYGFRIRPVPVMASSETWTLCYYKAPIILHWANDGTFIPSAGLKLSGSIPEAQGSRIDIQDYYKGELVHLIGDLQSGADTVLASSEVTSSNAITRVCTLRDNFAYPGIVKYEFRSFLPRGYDKLIALSVALSYTSERTDPERRKLMKEEYMNLLGAAKSYFRQTTIDRPMTRLVPMRDEVDPYAN